MRPENVKCRIAYLFLAWSMLVLPLHATEVVTIETSPPGAHIRINTAQSGISPARVILQPGQHLITATLNGYFTAFGTVSVTAEQEPQSLLMQLEPIPASLLIQTTPPGGQITINGQEHGQTPLGIRGMKMGLLACVVRTEGYAPLHIRYNVQAGTTALLHLQMQREAAEITIESDPPGASIAMDGAQQGATPMTLTNLPAGDATLTLVRPGYRTFSETLSLATGESRHINVTLLPEPSMLQITSTPERSRVLIDGHFRGRTPLQLPAFPAGVYQLTLEQPAYRTLQTNITITAGQEHTFDFALEVTGGTLSVTTSPTGTSVLLNDILSGETPPMDRNMSAPAPLQLHPLPQGMHTISLYKPGYRPISETIEIEEQAQMQRHYTLERIPAPNFEITTSTDVYTGYWAETNHPDMIEVEFENGIIRQIPRTEATHIRRLR